MISVEDLERTLFCPRAQQLFEQGCQPDISRSWALRGIYRQIWMIVQSHMMAKLQVPGAPEVIQLFSRLWLESGASKTIEQDKKVLDEGRQTVQAMLEGEAVRMREIVSVDEQAECTAGKMSTAIGGSLGTIYRTPLRALALKCLCSTSEPKIDLTVLFQYRAFKKKIGTYPAEVRVFCLPDKKWSVVDLRKCRYLDLAADYFVANVRTGLVVPTINLDFKCRTCSWAKDCRPIEFVC